VVGHQKPTKDVEGLSHSEEVKMDEVRKEVISLKGEVSNLIKVSNQIDQGVNGNGRKGLKERMSILETKYWILLFIVLAEAVAGIGTIIRSLFK